MTVYQCVWARIHIPICMYITGSRIYVSTLMCMNCVYLRRHENTPTHMFHLRCHENRTGRVHIVVVSSTCGGGGGGSGRTESVQTDVAPECFRFSHVCAQCCIRRMSHHIVCSVFVRVLFIAMPDATRLLWCLAHLLCSSRCLMLWRPQCELCRVSFGAGTSGIAKTLAPQMCSAPPPHLPAPIQLPDAQCATCGPSHAPHPHRARPSRCLARSSSCGTRRSHARVCSLVGCVARVRTSIPAALVFRTPSQHWG